MRTVPAAGYLIVPGIDGSDDDHWQSHWETAWASSALRIAPSSWTAPELGDWVAAMDRGVRQLRGDGHRQLAVVAHSLGCWAAAEWIARTHPSDTSAFLVAVPDPGGPRFPRSAAESFAQLAPTPLEVQALVVASDDDPYCSPSRSAEISRGWGAAWRNIGPFGHLNSSSGLGTWPEGRLLLFTMRRPDDGS